MFHPYRSVRGIPRSDRAWFEAQRLLWIVLAILLALYGCARAHAQSPRSAAVARGEHIARIVCSACHVVAKDQEFPPILDPPAPTFAEIANRAGMTAKNAERFVMRTHWDMEKIPMTMPNPMLEPSDAAAVAAYLMSLKKTP